MNFETTITNLLTSTSNSAELVQALSDYDQANNQPRLRQALNDYLLAVQTSKQDATTINDALASL